MPNFKGLYLHVDDELHRAVKIIAAERGITMRALFEEALRAIVAEQRGAAR